MSNGTKNTSAMVTNIARSTNRNLLIVESVKELMKEDRKILILSGRREHLETLHFLLNDAKIKTIHNKYITVGYYYGNNGGSTKSNHKAMLELSAKCDVILGTHAIASEGLDIPDLNTEIIATPLADVEQAVGRILRKFHTINPIVLDLIDNCGNFVNQARKRLKLYHREGYNEYDKVINLDNFNDEINNIISHINSPDHIISNNEVNNEDLDSNLSDDDILNEDKEISDDFSIDLFSKKKIKPTSGVCLI
jgi:superfamily II DNA or RNA helicase